MVNRQLINPGSIVIVGGSNDRSKVGGALIKNLTENNFQGTIYAVNPKEVEVQGFPCFKDVAEMPEVEMAIICVAAAYVKETVAELATNKKCKAFIVLSAGFSEMGAEGQKLQDDILEIINDNGGSLIGPNCIGVLTLNYAGIFAGPIPKLDPKGCDFVCASGATAAWIVEKGMLMGLSFSSMFTVGNSAQIGVEDVIQYWDETYDPETSSKIKLFYIESVNQPQKLLKHAASLIRKGCKIAAIKSGTSEAGSRAVTSHTGALASPDKAVDALFRKAGIVRCHGKEDLVTTAAVFCLPELKGKNIAIITQAGGPGVMLTDALEKGGLLVPHLEGPEARELLAKLFPGSSVANPIDFLATGTPEHVAHTIDAANHKFDNIDGMAVIFGSTGLTDITEALDVISAKSRISKKPIYTILPSVVTAKREADYFQALGNVSFSDEVLFARALVNVAKTPRPAEQVELPAIDYAAVRSIIDGCNTGYLAPEQVQALLLAAGIDCAVEAVVASQEEAVQKAGEVGFPVVMKVVGPVHKSDVGGVVLNVKDSETVATEFARMIKIADTTAILIQPMLSGTELFVGASFEEKFGHLVLCGLGGVFIEVLEDTASELSPVSKSQASEMIRSLKSYKIIQGARGQEGVDEQRFAETITRLSALCEAAPEIKELDLNPLLGSKHRVVAVDARIRIEQEVVATISIEKAVDARKIIETEDIPVSFDSHSPPHRSSPMKVLKTSLMIAAATIALGASIAGAAPDVVTLKVAHFMPASSNFQLNNAVPWCEKVAKESGGRLKCQIYPSMQLGGTPSQLFDQARDGVADIVWTVPTYQAGRFLKSEVFELPFMVNSAEKGSQAMWDYVQKNSLDEFKGTKLIFTHVHDGSEMHFGSKSVKNLEDLKGMKVRAPSRVGAQTLAALGAMPVQMPMPQVTEAISKAVVDGASLPWEITSAIKLTEICKTSTEVARGHKKHSNAIFVFAMNQKKYDSLPADLRKVIDNNSGREVAKWVGKIWDDGARVSRKKSVDHKNIINTLSQTEYARWVKATEKVDDAWVREVTAKGGNGKALLEDAKALLKKYND